jgi:plasmid stability protein
MPKMIQIRNVPDEIHRIFKARAAREGMTLSDYLKRELEGIAKRPTMQEWLERTKQLKPVRMKQSAAELIREMRDAR